MRSLAHDSGHGTRWREIVVAAVLYGAASVVLTLPVLGHPARTVPSDLIDTVLNAWILGWDAQRIPHLLGGVWNAPIFFPYHTALAFSENLFGVAVLVAPVYWISGNAVLTYNVAFVVSFAICGLGMYLLARSLGLAAPAAAVAGAAYAFCPFRFVHISHLQMVATGWIPITLWGLHEYLASGHRGWLAMFAAGYVLQALANSYVAYYLAVPVAIVFIAGWWRARGARLRAVVDVGVAAVAIAAALAPVGLQYFRVRHDYNMERSRVDMIERSPDVRSYLVAKDTIGLGRFLPTAVRSDPEKELFPGFAAVVLAIFAVALTRRGVARQVVWTYAAVAVAGWLLSLGPSVRVWGHVITEHGPYDWMLHVVPGADGMRVPGRFAIIFVFGLSMLAGCGAQALIARVERRGRIAAIVVMLLAIAADGWSVPLPVLHYPGSGRPEDRAVAAWLRDRPSGGVLHLPVRTINFEELHWQYATLAHRHPIVNGYSGYDTPLQQFLKDPRSPLYDFARFPAAVRMLRALGIRYVIVHVADYGLTARFAHEPENTLEGLRASAQVTSERRFLEAVAFELAPWTDAAAPAGAPIPASEFTMSASQAQDRVAALTDGDRDSRWIGSQDSGAWIAARFRSPHDIAALTLQIADRSLVDYPRELQIDSTDASGATTTLYRDSPYPEFGRALIANADYPPITIALPPNRTVTLTIHETAVEPGRWWSVHEIAFSERRARP